MRNAHPHVLRRSLGALLCGAAFLGAAMVPAHAADDGTLRLLSLNIWNKFKQTPAVTSDFMINGNWDVLMFQEANGSRYVSDIPGILKDAGLGTYGGNLIGDVGIISRLSGTYGSYQAPGLSTQGRYVSYQIIDGEAGRPMTTVGTVHLDYSDEATKRVAEAKALNAWAKTQTNPLIISGDFNAGDVSERGLHSKSQQELLLRIYTKSPNSFYYSLLEQYAKDKTALDQFIADWRGKASAAIDAATIPSDLFADETYPVAGNTPQTMNVLKKQFMLLQTDEEREQFAPHELNDGSATWPSAGEDATNTWGSWHRVKIDHFLASRPFGKWYTIADDPNDPYLGVIKDVYVTKPDGSTTPLSDHEPVAHEFRWIGPVLETYKETVSGVDVDKTRIVWSEDANTFRENGKQFYLTRNNMRQDVYLGQVSDENGMPILMGLTDAEKKTLLDCKSTDARFQQAIAEYCIDDHSFIGETLITDGGMVIVDEDAALGTSAADLRLDNGTLQIAGTAMTSLDRSVILEAGGGTIDVNAPSNKVTIAREISGTGAFTKAGAGTLNLTADNSYTGETIVAGGRLAVNGSIEDSVLTTVLSGGILGGNGTVGDLVVEAGGTVAPGNSIGRLNVAGDVTFEKGSTYEAEFDGSGNADMISATGSIFINGGSLYFIAAGSGYDPATDYTILSAGTGITGRFDSVGSDYAFLSPDMLYTPTGVTLRLERNDIDFGSVATSRNRVATAGGIESLGTGNALYSAVLRLDAATADEAFHQVSGEMYPSIAGALADDSRFVRDAVEQRLSGMEAVTGIAGQPGEDASGYQAWSQGFGSKGSTDGSGVDQLDRSTGGLLMGIDTMVTEDLRLGILGGYGRSSFSQSGQPASADADSYILGFYGSTQFDALRLSFGGSYGWNSIEADRDISFGSFTDSLKADYDAATAQIFGEAAYRMQLGDALFEPFAGLAQVHVSTNGFTEDGGAAALSVDDATYNVTFANIGLRAATSFDVGGTVVRLKGQASWRHAFSDNAPDASMALAGGSVFDIQGASASRDTAVVKAGVDFDVAKNSSVSVNYVGEFAAGGADHGVNAGFKLKF